MRKNKFVKQNFSTISAIKVGLRFFELFREFNPVMKLCLGLSNYLFISKFVTETSKIVLNFSENMPRKVLKIITFT